MYKMNKKKKFDKYNIIACISVLLTFIMIVVVVFYNLSYKKNMTVSIILYVLLGIFALTTIISVILFMKGTPRLKNK